MRALRTILFALIVAGAFALPRQARALEIEPGRWESVETSETDGKPGKPELSTDCVTPQDARDPVKALTGMQEQSGGKCKMADVKQEGNVVSFVMRCGEPQAGSIEMSASFTFDSPRHYTGTLTSTMTMLGQQTASKMTVDAKWIGVCKK